MLYFYIVAQLGLLVRRKLRLFLPLYQVPDALPSSFGGRESEHLARAEGGDEFDDFLVRSHESIVARSSDSGKPKRDLQKGCLLPGIKYAGQNAKKTKELTANLR